MVVEVVHLPENSVIFGVNSTEDLRKPDIDDPVP